MSTDCCNHYGLIKIMHRIKKISLLFTVLFVMESAYAEIPVILSGPTPPIPSTLSVGTSNTFVYTIINNVPNHSFPLIISGISSPIVRTSVPNDCGNVIPLGPSTCNFGIVIAPGQADAGNLVNQTLLVDYRGRRPLHSNIVFFAVGPTPPPPPDLAVLTAVGQNLTGTLPPLLVVTTNSGATWTVKNVIGLPPTGQFVDSDCTGSGATTICTAVGQNNTGGLTALVAVSTDGGNTWVVKTVAGLSTSQEFSATSCTGTGATAICTAAGQDFLGTEPPLLAVSTDGGNTWAVKAVAGLPANGEFNTTSCTGSGATAVCTAAGQNLAGGAALVAASTDGGNTWAVKAIAGAPIGTFNGSSCTGSGATAICTAVGASGGAPFLAVSTDGGNTWVVKAVAGAPASGTFEASSCTGSGATAICTAVGQNLTGSSPPLLAVSTDGGNTWAVKAVVGAPATGFFDGTSCTGAGATAICTAAGGDLTGTAPPLLAVSTDGGNTWAVKGIIGLPVTGNFNATSCTGSGTTAICIAAGQDGTGSTPPLLVMSIDGGNSWAVQTVIGMPTTGIFFGTGASNSLSNVLGKKYGIKNEIARLIQVN